LLVALLHVRLQVLPFEQQYLDALPSAQMYEKSYMHRDTVTHVVVSMQAASAGSCSFPMAAAAAADITEAHETCSSL
jgi:hypothetical protein